MNVKYIYHKGRLILRQNIFLGIYHSIRRFILNQNPQNNVFPSIRSYKSILNRNLINDYFRSNNKQKILLLEIANDFINNEINIYQKKINISEYDISRFHKKRNGTNIFNNDIRVHWEIYRAKFLFNVGMAYYISNNEKYSAAIINYVYNWKEYCPIFDKSIPYNGMEAGIKILNLFWVDCFLKNSPKYKKSKQKILTEAIVLHAEYMYKNYDISIYGLESNHGLSCGVALIFTSLLLPDYPRNAKWYRFGIRIIKRALKKQFSNDGVNFESSVQYHRYVFELLIIMLASLYRANKHISPTLIMSTKKIGEALLVLRHSNKLIPKIGDSDGGKIFYDLNTIGEFNSLEYLDWFTNKRNKIFYETIIFEDIPQFKNFLNPEKQNRISNYCSYKNSNISLIITGNQLGTSGKGNHQHNDFLSFELYSKYPFIVDPWSYCYTGNKRLRNNDRKTSSHNTVLIDMRDIIQFDEDRLFEMLGTIKVSIEKIVDGSKKWEIVLKHNGYIDLKNGNQIHERKFSYDKIYSELTVYDNLYGKGEHSANINFHIPQKYWELKQADEKLVFTNKYEEFSIINSLGAFKIKEGVISENFLNSVQSYNLCLKTDYKDRLCFETKIFYKKV